MQSLAREVLTIQDQIEKALELSGRKRVARLSSAKDNLAFALEDAHDIFG